MTKFTKSTFGFAVAAALAAGCADNQSTYERTTTVDPPSAPPTVTRERTTVDVDRNNPGNVTQERTVTVERPDGKETVTHERTTTVNPPVAPTVVPPRTVVIPTAPPPAMQETIPAPREGYMWVAGHYRHDGRNYYWVPGKYEPLPRLGARYTPGHWQPTTGGYVWVEGRWE